MHYLIWIPDDPAADPTETKQQRFERVGLADHVENAEAMPCAGPAGNGTLFCWRKNAPCDFNYDPNKQHWLKAAARHEWTTGRYWVGFSKEKPPLTRHLVRDYVRMGVAITLGDGQSWTIPKATELPETVKLLDDGSEKFVTVRKFHAYYTRAVEIARIMEAGGDISYGELFHFCVDTLRINYRLTPEIASHFELFDTDNIREFVSLVLGARDG